MSKLTIDVTKLRFIDENCDGIEDSTFVSRVQQLATNHDVSIAEIAFHFDSDLVTFTGETVKLACLILDFESDLSIAVGMIRSIKE